MNEKRLNIIITAPFIYYPFIDGGRVSQFNMIDYLQYHHNITLVFIAKSNECLRRIQAVKEMLPLVDIEIIIDTEDNLKISVINKIADLINLWVLKILSKISSYYDHNVNSNPLDFFQLKSKNIIDQFIAIFNKKKFDLAQFDMHPLIDLVFCVPSTCKKVFIQHEIGFKRLQTHFQSKLQPISDYNCYTLSIVKDFEISLLRKFDAVITFSHEDRELLLPEMTDSLILVSPFPVHGDYFLPINNNLTIKKIIFLGGSKHHPNKDAVEWFLKYCMPTIYTQTGLLLHIVGEWERNDVLKYNNNPYVIFSGFVDDLINYCKDSIMVVPIRQASGIRTKILHAMAMGIPVVSTRLGYEGIGLKDMETVFEAESPHDFITQINLIVNETELTSKIIVAAQKIALQNFSTETAGRIRNNAFIQIVN